jgi:hypothetical protein
VQFESLWPAIILFIALQLIGMFVGNVIYPRMQGRSLNIDPVAVLLALAFWGAIWGLAGAFLSTPLTVMIMIIRPVRRHPLDRRAAVGRRRSPPAQDQSWTTPPTNPSPPPLARGVQEILDRKGFTLTARFLSKLCRRPKGPLGRCVRSQAPRTQRAPSVPPPPHGGTTRRRILSSGGVLASGAGAGS